MNNRIRQKIKAQIEINKNHVMVLLRDHEDLPWTAVSFIDKDQVESYKEKYGNKMEIFPTE